MQYRYRFFIVINLYAYAKCLMKLFSGSAILTLIIVDARILVVSLHIPLLSARRDAKNKTFSGGTQSTSVSVHIELSLIHTV